MPAPQHYRVTWSGVFGTLALPVEEWSMGLSLGPVDGSPFLTRADLEADLNAFSDAWVELQAGVGNNCHLTETTLALVDATGHTPREASGAFIQAKGLGTALSGTGTSGMPLQVALVISQHSLTAGATGRGRFYLPSPVPGTVASDGRMSVATRDAHLLRATAFCNAVQNLAVTNGYGTLVVASSGSASQGIAPGLRPVINVSVGRVLDTQRRRRGDLEEERLLAAV